MSTVGFIALLGVSILCIVVAFRMAILRGRRPRLWMWSAVLLGPLPLVVLAFVPRREQIGPI